MELDAHFVIGAAHGVCEDYAIARSSEDGRAIAVVSDGCSSSPGSDVGARVMAHCGVRSPDMARVLRRADAIRRALGLPPHALDATLLRLDARRDGAVVHAWGDGFVLARRRDGTLEVHRIEYPSHAPAYPAYALNPARAEAYRAAGLGERRITSTTGATADAHADAVVLSFDARAYDLVAIASDGLAAVIDREHAHVPALDVAQALARLRSTRGAFVQRRLRRFATRDCAALGWTPTDDIALAAVAWEER
jgi:hypothetical protein